MMSKDRVEKVFSCLRNHGLTVKILPDVKVCIVHAVSNIRDGLYSVESTVDVIFFYKLGAF